MRSRRSPPPGEALDDAAAGATCARSRGVCALACSASHRRSTVPDLSALVEAALIEHGAFDVAKALVMRRVAHGRSRRRGAGEPRLLRRSGHVVPWNTRKIEVAIRKAFLSLTPIRSRPRGLPTRVSLRTRSLGARTVPIETVQDIVQEELVLCGQMRVAERYILYRAERAMLRAEGPAPPAAAIAVTGRATR